jgi:hypothetical protein
MAILLAGIFIAFCLAYFVDQKRKIRNERRRERSQKKFENMLDQLKQSERARRTLKGE